MDAPELPKQSDASAPDSPETRTQTAAKHPSDWQAYLGVVIVPVGCIMCLMVGISRADSYSLSPASVRMEHAPTPTQAAGRSEDFGALEVAREVERRFDEAYRRAAEQAARTGNPSDIRRMNILMKEWQRACQRMIQLEARGGR